MPSCGLSSVHMQKEECVCGQGARGGGLLCLSLPLLTGKGPIRLGPHLTFTYLKALYPIIITSGARALTYDFFCGEGAIMWPHEKNKRRARRPQRPGAGDLKLDLRTPGLLSTLLQKPKDGLYLLRALAWPQLLRRQVCLRRPRSKKQTREDRDFGNKRHPG